MSVYLLIQNHKRRPCLKREIARERRRRRRKVQLLIFSLNFVVARRRRRGRRFITGMVQPCKQKESPFAKATRVIFDVSVALVSVKMHYSLNHLAFGNFFINLTFLWGSFLHHHHRHHHHHHRRQQYYHHHHQNHYHPHHSHHHHR